MSSTTDVGGASRGREGRMAMAVEREGEEEMSVDMSQTYL
jgi:hypothetical protein